MVDSDFDSVAAANAANMSTTLTDTVIQNFKPERFSKGQDIEVFIEQCEIFFTFARMTIEQRQVMVICFLDRDLVETYKRVDKSIKDYKERLRKAFKVERPLLQDIKAIFSYKRTNETAEKYFEEIDKLVNNFFRADLTKDELTEQLLIECANEKGLKRDVCINNIKGVEDVKARIRKLDEVDSILEDVATIGQHGQTHEIKRSYRDAVRNLPYNQKVYAPTRQNHETTQKKEQGRQTITRNIECWSCHEKGHASQQCPRKVIKCFACGEVGHIRRQCPKVKCQRCHNSGHHANVCYTNLRRLGGNRYDGRYHRNWQGQGRTPRHRTTGEPGRNQVNNVEESSEEEPLALGEHPKAKASTEVEIVGAIH